MLFGRSGDMGFNAECDEEQEDGRVGSEAIEALRGEEGEGGEGRVERATPRRRPQAAWFVELSSSLSRARRCS
eukprot:2504999-Pyramimonas_sp.AAC.1